MLLPEQRGQLHQDYLVVILTVELLAVLASHTSLMLYLFGILVVMALKNHLSKQL